MLVSELRNESLANLVSGSDVKLADVHKSLRECAQAIRDRYLQKQAKNTVKRRIKTHATEVLLEELSKVPEDSAATRETIASALKRHVEALRNHEHLLSKKGNTYALLQQTQALRKEYDDAPAEPAPLLQYHGLKDKLLASDFPLSTEQKEVISALAKKKSLALKTLEILEAYPSTSAKDLMRLNEIILITPELCSGAFNPEDSLRLAKIFIRLHEAGMHRPELCAGVLKHENPCIVVDALVELKQNNLDTPGNCSAVLKSKSPLNDAFIIIKLHSCHLLSDEIRDLVLKNKRSAEVVQALFRLNKHPDLFADWYTLVAEHEEPDKAVSALLVHHFNEIDG